MNDSRPPDGTSLWWLDGPCIAKALVDRHQGRCHSPGFSFREFLTVGPFIQVLKFLQVRVVKFHGEASSNAAISLAQVVSVQRHQHLECAATCPVCLQCVPRSSPWRRPLLHGVLIPEAKSGSRNTLNE